MACESSIILVDVTSTPGEYETLVNTALAANPGYCFAGPAGPILTFGVVLSRCCGRCGEEDDEDS